MSRRRKSCEVHGPTQEERDLFREAVSDAVPLPANSRRANLELAPPPAIVHSPGSDALHVPPSWLNPEPCSALLSPPCGVGEPFRWLRPGLPRKQLDDLEKARWKVEAHLDLHGLDRDVARDRLIAFIDQCLLARLRCVSVIHGQGRSPGSSGQEPALKAMLRRWLAHRPEVLAYCQASGRGGGAGAVWVLLRMRRRD